MKKVQIINKSQHPLPSYATPGSSGMDLRANIKEVIDLKPLERTLVSTGLYIALPPYTEGQIRSRSGLSYKHGIIVLNTPGTIDSDYRGEIKVLLANFSNTIFSIKNGDRIAQLVLASNYQVTWEEVTNLKTTKRAKGGYGSTGIE